MSDAVKTLEAVLIIGVVVAGGILVYKLVDVGSGVVRDVETIAKKVADGISDTVSSVGTAVGSGVQKVETAAEAVVAETQKAINNPQTFGEGVVKGVLDPVGSLILLGDVISGKTPIGEPSTVVTPKPVPRPANPAIKVFRLNDGTLVRYNWDSGMGGWKIIVTNPQTNTNSITYHSIEPTVQNWYTLFPPIKSN